MSNSLKPYGLYGPYGLSPTRLLYPWDSPGKNTGVGCLPSPTPGEMPDPGIEPASLMSPALAGRFFTTSATWKAPFYIRRFVNISLLVECIFLDEMLRRKVSSGAASRPSGLSVYPGQQKEHCPQSRCIISFSPKCLCFVNWKAVLVCVPWKQNLKQVLGRKEFFLRRWP